MGGVKSKRTVPLKPKPPPTLHHTISENNPIKVTLLGDAQTGKTALAQRITQGTFVEAGGEPSFTPAQGEEGLRVAFPSGHLPGVAYLKVHDYFHPNFNRFRAVRQSTPYRGMHVLVFMFDLELRASWGNVAKWIKEADRYGNDIENSVKMIVGTKLDAVDDPYVTRNREKKIKELEIDKTALSRSFDNTDPTGWKKKVTALLCLQFSTSLFCVKENFRWKSCILFPDEIMILIIELLNRAIQSIVPEYIRKRTLALHGVNEQLRYWNEMYIENWEVEDFADQYAMAYHRVSNKTGEGVEKMVVDLVKQHSERMENDDL